MNCIDEKAHIFGSVFVLANRLQTLCDKIDENITTKQWLLLVGIFKNESDAPAISEVANFIGNSRQNVKKMALILNKKGFIHLEKDSKDARILRISLTSKCQDYFKQRENTELEFLGKLYDGFDTELIKSLDSGISKLEKNIIEMEKQYD